MKKENEKETILFLEGVGLLTMLAFGAFVMGCAFTLGIHVVVSLFS